MVTTRTLVCGRILRAMSAARSRVLHAPPKTSLPNDVLLGATETAVTPNCPREAWAEGSRYSWTATGVSRPGNCTTFPFLPRGGIGVGAALEDSARVASRDSRRTTLSKDSVGATSSGSADTVIALQTRASTSHGIGRTSKSGTASSNSVDPISPVTHTPRVCHRACSPHSGPRHALPARTAILRKKTSLRARVCERHNA
mmetsp:Transcript_59200/g.157587  ORF Transcript_59200/g.157587 Transcript_59200/m.157587 type:complete len:200 (-) Transcript_59200:127-726(-)